MLLITIIKGEHDVCAVYRGWSYGKINFLRDNDDNVWREAKGSVVKSND